METITEWEPLISAKALEKSGRVLKALSLLYFPFYNLQPIRLFDCYGTLSFVSAIIYQADELNEVHETSIERPLLKLQHFLEDRGLRNQTISNYIVDGETYFSLERIFRSRKPENLEEIVKAMNLRSFDFRILHCLLCHFHSIAFDQLVFDAFATLEILMEIDDDLISYEKDFKNHTFNFPYLVAWLLQNNRKTIRTIETFRNALILRIGAHKSQLPPVLAFSYAEIVSTYFKLVAQPILPTNFLVGDA